MGLLDKLRGAAEVADEIEADEVEADEVDADEVDEIEADEVEADAEGDPQENPDEVEDPAADDESPEVAELRATLLEQAAEIETLRNRLAAAGIEDDVEPDPVEIEVDEDTTEEDAVSAFDSDYAEREAALAEIKKDN
jgi:hypothetical protein